MACRVEQWCVEDSFRCRTSKGWGEFRVRKGVEKLKDVVPILMTRVGVPEDVLSD